MNSKKVKAWNANPPSKMLLGVVVSRRFDAAAPMSAAPRIWMMVAMMSQVMKIQRMSLGLTVETLASHSHDSRDGKGVYSAHTPYP
jgi:hypothetical protein